MSYCSLIDLISMKKSHINLAEDINLLSNLLVNMAIPLSATINILNQFCILTILGKRLLFPSYFDLHLMLKQLCINLCKKVSYSGAKIASVPKDK